MSSSWSILVHSSADPICPLWLFFFSSPLTYISLLLCDVFFQGIADLVSLKQPWHTWFWIIVKMFLAPSYYSEKIYKYNCFSEITYTHRKILKKLMLCNGIITYSQSFALQRSCEIGPYWRVMLRYNLL